MVVLVKGRESSSYFNVMYLSCPDNVWQYSCCICIYFSSEKSLLLLSLLLCFELKSCSVSMKKISEFYVLPLS